MNLYNLLKEEKGTSLLELLVAMPVITILITSFGVLVCWGIKTYICLKTDYELQEQVRIPLERITRDLRYANNVRTIGSSLAIQYRKADGTLEWTAYDLADTNKEYPKITCRTQPLTGESRIAKIKITKFFHKISNKTVYVEISAYNKITNREFTLHTAVTLPAKGV